MAPAVSECSKHDDMWVIFNGPSTIEFDNEPVCTVGLGDVGIAIPGKVTPRTVRETVTKVLTNRL
ncbi:hypothetical protein ABZX77_02265 [Streptomyces sp. NPDC004237]|uniref:hypothetical protein n=1 Tax=Streptomyces sp. NPDC004237 TaxID=3154455 RepID=UPI0033B99E9A